MTNEAPAASDILFRSADCFTQLRSLAEGSSVADVYGNYRASDFETNKHLFALEMTLITAVKRFPLEQI